MRASVTQIEQFQLCEVKHDYSYQRRLEPVQEDSSAIYQRIGRVVAESIEIGIKKGVDGKRPAKAYASDYLSAQLGDEKDLEKAAICVDKLPDHIWDIPLPMSEDKLEVEYGSHTVVGVPDLWWVESDDEGVLALHVEEFKTGYQAGSKASEKLVNYEKWGIQASRYAVLLHDKYEWLRGLPIYRRHILMSYSGRGKAYVGRELLVSDATLDKTRTEMLTLVERMDTLVTPTHHFGMLCNWCKYSPICWGYLTGLDEDDIIATSYKRKERK